MKPELEQRQVEAWEAIATALAGIHETARSAVSKLWPEPAGQREVIVTRAETAEEKALKEQGNVLPKSDLNRWLDEDFGGEGGELYVGEREREFLSRQRSASTEARQVGGQADGGTEAPQGEAGTTGESSTDQHPTQES